MAKPNRYKYCMVPKCVNTTITAPGKLFINLPNNETIRKKWCQAMNRDNLFNPRLSAKSVRHVCEDHFDLEKDMENYLRYRLQGGKIFMKKDVLPHIFNCQTSPPATPKSSLGKRRKRMVISESMAKTILESMAVNQPTAVTSGVKCDGPHARMKLWKKFRDKSLQSSRTSSREEEKQKDLLPLEPTVVIKEEPVDYDPTPSTSTDIANEEFILPHNEHTWAPPVNVLPEPVVEPQFTLSVAKLASTNNPEASVGELARTKRQIEAVSATLVPSTNCPEERQQSPVYSFGESSNPGSSKEPRKDQFDVFGEYVAAKLRSLDRTSCAFAQKAIGDIIFEAEMGKYLHEISKTCAN